MLEFDGSGPDGVRPGREPGMIATAIWLGLVIGLLEVGLLLIEKENNHISAIGALRLNRHYPWMIPTAHLAIFGGCGLALELAGRTSSRVGKHLGPRALAALALLSLLVLIRELHPAACLLLAVGMAGWVVPLARRLRPGFARVVRFSLPVLIVGLVILVAGRHAQFALARRAADAREPAVGSPNVLLIVLDTVRAKSLSLHGYSRPTTPRLERLARSGVKFEQARSAAPWTLPSHASLFTGRWPSDLFDHPEQKLDPSVPTLAGALARNGYATAGFVANTFYCNAGFGLSKGFDHYEDFYEDFDTTPAEVLRNAEIGRRLFSLVGDEVLRPDGRKDADRINADFLSWQSTRGGRPFFAFLNYLDAHAPYLVPPRADRHFGRLPATIEDFQVLASWQKRKTMPADPGEIELARDAYDDCIGYLDDALGRLFDELDRRGVLENTLVIVTSDHGEEIGEHGLFGHGRSLYGEELHVPLLIVKPGRVPSGRVVSAPVSLRDVPATVVDLLGLADSSPFPGRSMAPLWSGDAAPGRPGPGIVLSEVGLCDEPAGASEPIPAMRGPMVSIASEGMVYIREGDGRERLYRLEDSAQQADLAEGPEVRPVLERLRALVDRERDGR